MLNFTEEIILVMTSYDEQHDATSPLVDVDHAVEEGPEEEVCEHLAEEAVREEGLPGAEELPPGPTGLGRQGVNYNIVGNYW